MEEWDSIGLKVEDEGGCVSEEVKRHAKSISSKLS